MLNLCRMAALSMKTALVWKELDHYGLPLTSFPIFASAYTSARGRVVYTKNNVICHICFQLHFDQQHFLCLNGLNCVSDARCSVAQGRVTDGRPCIMEITFVITTSCQTLYFDMFCFLELSCFFFFFFFFDSKPFNRLLYFEGCRTLHVYWTVLTFRFVLQISTTLFFQHDQAIFLPLTATPSGKDI